MKKPLKIFFLLMALGLTVGCSGKSAEPSSTNSDSSNPSSSEPSSSEPSETPVVNLSSTSAYVKVGEYVEVTASLSVPNANATFTATADKEYATTQVSGSTIRVTLSDSAVVDETVTVTVASEGATSATLTITVVTNETYYTVFFFQSFVGETNVATLKTEFNTLLANFDHVIYEVYADSTTTVKPGAQAVASYNEGHYHKINALIGFNGDSDNILSKAGYQQYSEQNYRYGTDQARKLWVEKEPEYSETNDAIQQYLLAHYGPEKVQLSKKRGEAKPGQTITVPASLDIPLVDSELIFTAESNKSYATVTVVGNQVSVAMSESAIVGEVAVVTVSCGTYTSASIAITIIAQDAVVGNDLVVAFYNKYVTEEKRTEIENGFNAYLAANSISLGSVTFVGLGNSKTNVAQFAGFVMNYNDDFSNPHMVNVMLGTRGDSNDALANAGYKRLSETEYNFQKSGESNRKIWVTSEYDTENPMPAIKALVDFMDATYAVPAE